MITQFDLSREIQELLPLLATSIPKLVDLRLNLEAGLPLVEADPSQTEQVIMNLVINGAEAIGSDGGIIRVSTGRVSTGRVSTGVSALASGDEVYVEIAESGSRMDEALKARIFDPLSTTKLTGRGRGLSRMTVDSAAGKGTTIRVFFPAVQSAAPKKDDVVSQPQTSARGKILIVDDEALLRELAEAILIRLGYEISVAENGRKALEIFAPDPDSFAAVILDMTMPVMGGKETLRRIREIHSTVPVIIATGYSEDETRDELETDTALAFIQKPYNAERLTAKILEVLSAGG